HRLLLLPRPLRHLPRGAHPVHRQFRHQRAHAGGGRDASWDPGETGPASFKTGSGRRRQQPRHLPSAPPLSGPGRRRRGAASSGTRPTWKASRSPQRALLLRRALGSGAHAAPAPVRLRLLARSPLRRAFASLSAGAFPRVLGWQVQRAMQKEVRAAAFSPHSSGGVQSSGWDVLVAAVATAAAAEAPEPCTPQAGTRGWPGGRNRGEPAQ
ncbi:uncharacterized protein, partial [Delphinus delphis]|uniref:uncharacterized protein n=1 Tax=Delphinus delphis TaxID=9728 RepID=UPI0028C458B9